MYKIKEFLFEYLQDVDDDTVNKNGIIISPVLINSDNNNLTIAKNIEILLIKTWGTSIYTLPNYTIRLENKKDFKNNLFGINELTANLSHRFYGVKVNSFSARVNNSKYTNIALLCINNWEGTPKQNKNIRELRWINIEDYIKEKIKLNITNRADSIIKAIWVDVIKKELKNNYVIEDFKTGLCSKYFNKELDITLPSCSPNNFLRGIYNEKIILTPDKKDYIGFIAQMNKNKYNHLEIAIVYVNKKYRGKGYSKILMKLFPAAQILFVDPTNREALGLYKKLGWINSGIEKSFNKNNPNDKRLLLYNPKNISKEEIVDGYIE